jgi:hypothetical protein
MKLGGSVGEFIRERLAEGADGKGNSLCNQCYRLGLGAMKEWEASRPSTRSHPHHSAPVRSTLYSVPIEAPLGSGRGASGRTSGQRPLQPMQENVAQVHRTDAASRVPFSSLDNEDLGFRASSLAHANKVLSRSLATTTATSTNRKVRSSASRRPAWLACEPGGAFICESQT